MAEPTQPQGEDTDGRNFRAIDIAGVGVCDATPDSTYTTLVACSNCGFEGEGRFPKGTAIYSCPCPNCRVIHRLDERNAVRMAERAARRELDILQAQSGEALLRKILADRDKPLEYLKFSDEMAVKISQTLQSRKPKATNSGLVKES